MSMEEFLSELLEEIKPLKTRRKYNYEMIDEFIRKHKVATIGQLKKAVGIPVTTPIYQYLHRNLRCVVTPEGIETYDDGKYVKIQRPGYPTVYTLWELCEKAVKEK